MSRNRQIFFIFALSLECYNHPDYFENLWRDGIRKSVGCWCPKFIGDYSIQEMENDVVSLCSPIRNENNPSLFWYQAPSDCTNRESIQLATIVLFESLNYFFNHKAPAASAVSQEIIKEVLKSRVLIPFEDYNLEKYDFEKIREVLAEGTKGRFCDWLGEDRPITSYEWMFLSKGGFPFNKPRRQTCMIFCSCKVKDLDHAGLYMYIDEYKPIWENCKDNNQRTVLFGKIKDFLWEKVIEGASGVWGG